MLGSLVHLTHLKQGDAQTPHLCWDPVVAPLEPLRLKQEGNHGNYIHQYTHKYSVKLSWTHLQPSLQ